MSVSVEIFLQANGPLVLVFTAAGRDTAVQSAPTAKEKVLKNWKNEISFGVRRKNHWIMTPYQIRVTLLCHGVTKILTPHRMH